MKTSHWIYALLAFALGTSLFIALLHSQSASLSFFLDFKFDVLSLVVVFALSLLYILLGGWKWQLISKQWHGQAPSLSYHFAQTSYAMLWAQFLPFPIATALQRSAALKLRQKVPVFHGLAHAIFDIGFDLWIILLFLPASIAQAKFHFSFIIWLMIGLGTLVIFSLIFPALRFFFKKQPHTTLGEKLTRPSFIATMLGLSLARFATIVLRLCFGASALGLSIPWDVISFATSPATVPSLVPLTPAGLGIVEWGWAYLLMWWDIPMATGILYATGFRVLSLIAFVLIAANFFLFIKKKPRASQLSTTHS